MPKRDDIKSVLVIGSGPIVIGQACEFDYSGTQACRVLREEGIRVILVNSNPATIMTDPEFADATYVEPITPEVVEPIIATERPDAVLATLGGQTALNCAIALHEAGVLEKYGGPLIGANVEAIQLGEDRAEVQGRRRALRRRVRPLASSATPWTSCSPRPTTSATRVVVRPSFTMGGLGSGFAYDEADLRRIAGAGLQHSPTTEVLLEESILGWKEYELEVMRDHADNVVVVCSIENLDPMGVHTGDSITVAPALTLTDREYQRLRDIGIAIIREVGVDTGGCNIQFAVNPADGRIIVIEMNPRVSRSSRAGVARRPASRSPRSPPSWRSATRLDEMPERHHPRDAGVASSRPSTTSSSRCRGSRSRSSRPPTRRSTTTMKSVGEAMAIGRNFTEALQKALRSLERRDSTLPLGRPEAQRRAGARLLAHGQDAAPTAASSPCSRRCAAACRSRRSTRRPASTRGSSTRWQLINDVAEQVAAAPELTPDAAAAGQAARVLRRPARVAARHARGRSSAGSATRSGVRPVYKTVDTCAAEFAALTPYHYSTYDEETEVAAARASRPSSSSAAARTASARASSSTTPACTPASPCATPATTR